MSIRVDVHETIQVIQISVDGDTVFLPRSQATEFLAKFMRAMAESIPEPDTYSRKVPDTPALRLVGALESLGAFHCDPDESCGQDGAA
jgi:hypothetical protein